MSAFFQNVLLVGILVWTKLGGKMTGFSSQNTEWKRLSLDFLLHTKSISFLLSSCSISLEKNLWEEEFYIYIYKLFLLGAGVLIRVAATTELYFSTHMFWESSYFSPTSYPIPPPNCSGFLGPNSQIVLASYYYSLGYLFLYSSVNLLPCILCFQNLMRTLSCWWSSTFCPLDCYNFTYCQWASGLLFQWSPKREWGKFVYPSSLFCIRILIHITWKFVCWDNI